MTSIRKEVEISGSGLMKNKPCTVRLVPSKTGKIRYFVKNAEPFDADVDNVISTQNCVVLGNKKSSIMLTEHLSAALAFCGIDSLDIHADGEELPILDGSAKEWVELLKGAGIDKPLLEKPRHYTVSEPVYYLNGKTSLVILPADELRITYAVNYDHPDLKQRWVTFGKPKEIIEARTFGFYKDLKKFQTLGLARGVTLENTVGLTDNGYTTELHSENEPIKHKILDLIGDLYLTGINPLNLKAQILVKEAGHAVHVKAARELKGKLI
ncbi:MAG: UDP-3-O-acyl-N-acetylglucosamine deacetylase [Heliobacteriaceae bacterium]|jgi:UDP-3-O-[3-hydroxymyristoyl] N-acetylglucosamine deacetylase|nr:UDP-3-O-acyl-N-acetylglucosamine deacetylase [Heliobacteriaceae bacterium]